MVRFGKDWIGHVRWEMRNGEKMESRLKRRKGRNEVMRETRGNFLGLGK